MRSTDPKHMLECSEQLISVCQRLVGNIRNSARPVLHARSSSVRWPVFHAGIKRQSIRQGQLHATPHLLLEILQLVHATLQYGRFFEILHPHLRLEYVRTAQVKQLKGCKGGQLRLGRFLDAANAGLM